MNYHKDQKIIQENNTRYVCKLMVAIHDLTSGIPMNYTSDVFKLEMSTIEKRLKEIENKVKTALNILATKKTAPLTKNNSGLLCPSPCFQQLFDKTMMHPIIDVYSIHYNNFVASQSPEQMINDIKCELKTMLMQKILSNSWFELGEDAACADKLAKFILNSIDTTGADEFVQVIGLNNKIPPFREFLKFRIQKYLKLKHDNLKAVIKFVKP